MFKFADLKQYVPQFDQKQHVVLKSSTVLVQRACFKFQYIASRWTSLDNSKMVVYVQNVSNAQLLPVSYRRLSDENSKWNNVSVLLNFETGLIRVRV